MARDWRRFVDTNPPVLTPVPHWARFLIEMIGDIMTTQDQINADVATIATAVQSFADSQAKIAGDLQAISAQLAAQGADTTGLDAVAANVTSGAAALADTANQLDAIANPPSPSA